MTVSGVASYEAVGHVPSSTFNDFIFSSLWSKSDSQISNYCMVCEISWCRCQQLTALSISTAWIIKLLVIEQMLQPALKFTVSAHDIISIFAPPRNKSWRRHWWQYINIIFINTVPWAKEDVIAPLPSPVSNPFLRGFLDLEPLAGVVNGNKLRKPGAGVCSLPSFKPYIPAPIIVMCGWLM